MAFQSNRSAARSMMGVLLIGIVPLACWTPPAAAQVRFSADARRLLHEAKTLAELSGGLRQLERLTILLAAAHRLDNQNAEALQALVNLSQARQDAKSLQIYLQRYVALVPKDEVAQGGLLGLKLQEALSNLRRQRVLREATKDIDLPPATRAWAHAMLAGFALRAGAARVVSRDLQKAYALHADSTMLWATVLDAARATRGRGADRPAAAFAQILLRQPTHVQYGWQFADELYRLGLLEDANWMYDYCRAVNPTIAGGGDLDAPFLLHIAGARYAAGQGHADAADAATDPAARNAAVLEAVARYNEALAICRQILKEDANSLGAYELILQSLQRKYDVLAGDPLRRNQVKAEIDATLAEAVKICETLVPDPAAASDPKVLTQVAAFGLFYRQQPTLAERRAAAAAAATTQPTASQKITERDVDTWDKLAENAMVLSERARRLAPTDVAAARIWAWAMLLNGKAEGNNEVVQILNQLFRRNRGDQLAALGLGLAGGTTAQTTADPARRDQIRTEANELLMAAYNIDRYSPVGLRALRAVKAAGLTPEPRPPVAVAAGHLDVFRKSPAAGFYKDKSLAVQARFHMEMAERRQYEFGVPLEALCMLTNPVAPFVAPKPATAPAPTVQSFTDPLDGVEFTPKPGYPSPVTFGPQGLLMPRVVVSAEILEKPGHVIGRLTEADLYRRDSLGPREFLSQSIRLDVGPLDSILMQMPQATLTLKFTPLIGTEGLEDDPTRPGPDGFAGTPVQIVRKGFQVTAENMKSLLANLAGAAVEKKIAAATLVAALYHEATFPATKRYEGYAPKPVDTAALSKAFAAAMRDPSWQVRAATARLAVWLGQEPEIIAALKAAARDPIWVVRLCAIDMLAMKLGKGAETLINSAAISDADPMVKQMAFYHSRRLLGYKPR